MCMCVCACSVCVVCVCVYVYVYVCVCVCVVCVLLSKHLCKTNQCLCHHCKHIKHYDWSCDNYTHTDSAQSDESSRIFTEDDDCGNCP